MLPVGMIAAWEFPGLKPLAEFAPGVILQHDFPVISHNGPPFSV